MKSAAITGLFLSLGACAGLSAESANSGARCEVTDLESVFRDPVPHSDKLFCGEVLAYPESRVVIMLPVGWPSENRRDLVMLAEGESEELLLRVNPDRPFRAYVRGRLDVMPECFDPSPPPGHMCVPFRRPIFIDLTEARRTD